MLTRMAPTALATCVALVSAASGARAATLWQNDWLISSPPTLQGVPSVERAGKPSTAIAFAANHDRVIAAPSPHASAYHIVRMAADGSARWSAGIHDYNSDAQVFAIRALDDGGAMVALGYPGVETYSDGIVRYAADGGLVWSRILPTGWLARVSPTRTASAGCSRLTVFDDADGNVAWQRELGSRTSCSTGGLAADAQGNLYASIERQANFSVTGYRIVAFDPGGAPKWQVESDDPHGGDVVGVDGARLHVRGGSELRALRLTDGSLAWSTPIAAQARIVFSGDGTHEAIVIGGGTVQRLASDTGVPRWSIPLAGDVTTADVIEDAMLLAISDGSRIRVDTEIGSVVWNVPPIGAPVRWFAFGDLEGNSVQGLAQAQPEGPGAMPAVIHAIDFASGQITGSTALPAIPQGFNVADTLAMGGDVLNSGVSQHSGFPHFRLRRVDAAGGATAWELDEPIDDFDPGYRFALPSAQVATSGERIVASMAISDGFDCHVAGWARISSYRLADGERNWVATLRDLDQLCSRVSAPVSDAAGNVFVSVSAIVPCEDGTVMGCQRRTLYKLAAADGSVEWRVDEELDAGIEGLVADPKPLHVFGADVVVPGGFVGSTASLRRHSGADGSILWSSTEFTTSMRYTGRIDVIDDHHLVLHASDQSAGTIGWAGLDADNGATLWSSQAPAIPCVPFGSCSLGYASDPRVLPDGTLLDAYQQDFTPWLSRWYYDGSGQIDHWMAAPGSPRTSFAIAWLSPDASHATLRHRHRTLRGSMQLLAGLDPSTGLLQAQRAIYGYQVGLLESHTWKRPLSLPAANRLLTTTHSSLPSHPVAQGVALLDTTVVATGNLSIEAAVDSDRVGPGEVVGFEVKLRYLGDGPAEGTRLQLRLPWNGGVRNLVCTTIGTTTCAIDLRNGQVDSTVDIASGGGVDIRGDIDVLAAGETLAFTAMATGPLGLAELDTRDNFAEVPIRQSLFRNGFEPVH
jgi:outer membrane protein assembly factor BamB